MTRTNWIRLRIFIVTGGIAVSPLGLGGQAGEADRVLSFTHPELAVVEDVEVTGSEIHVLDGLGAADFVFDLDGRLIRKIGGEGSGPGELRSPNRMGWAGDTLWIRDVGNQRFNFYDGNGTPIGTRRLYVRVPAPTRMVARVGGEWILANGRVLGQPEVPWPLIADGRVDSTTFYFVEDTAIVGTFLRANIDGSIMGINEVGRDFMQRGGYLRPALLSRHDEVVASAAGDLLAAVDLGSYTIRSYALDGTVLREMTVPHSERRTRDDLLASLVDQVLEDLGSGFRNQFPSDAALRGLVREAIGEPATLPPVTRAVAGNGGVIWLRREHEVAELVTWDRFRLMAGDRQAVLLPSAFVGMGGDRDRVWGVRLDEYDVPIVEIYAIP